MTDRVKLHPIVSRAIESRCGRPIGPPQFKKKQGETDSSLYQNECAAKASRKNRWQRKKLKRKER